MKPRFILASGSPRRRELLTSVGVQFEVITSVVDESELAARNACLSPASLVRFLASEKALEVADRTDGDAIVLGADTLVVIGGEILGKPIDEDDAAKMLIGLGGRTHQVHTGIAICIVENGIVAKTMTEGEVTAVTFAPVSAERAQQYVATGEPMDKAGAYGIQAKGALLVDRIDGDYFNVVGLPLAKLGHMLEELGYSLW